MAMKLKELSDYYQQLQSRLQHYATLKTRLDTKGDEVRKEISRQVDEEGELLRAREKQLLRQVDVAAAHFMSVYLVHHAHLHQLVGVAQNFLARHSSSSSDDDEGDDSKVDAEETTEKEAKDLVDRIRSGLKLCDLAQGESTADVLPISVTFGAKSIADLEKCIMEFGQVGSGKAFHRAPFGSSADAELKNGFGFLPYGHEDYQDSETEVLQSKPLLGTPSLIRFPKRVLGVVPNNLQVGVSPEEKSRWLLQHLEKKSETHVTNVMKPSNDGHCWLKMMKEDSGEDLKKRSGSSSFSESIEILGNEDDCEDAHWAEDDEFLLLKTFCKRNPVCEQFSGCCDKTSAGHCLKRALEKPIATLSSVPAVNIHCENRSVGSRAVNWLLMKNNNNKSGAGGSGTGTGSGNGFRTVAWKLSEANSEWREHVASQWERIWKADNETWLIRRKRIMDQNAEKVEKPEERVEITPSLTEKPTFDRVEMTDRRWILSSTTNAEQTQPETPKIFAQNPSLKDDIDIWRLAPTSTPTTTPTSSFAADLATIRREKSESCAWLVEAKGKIDTVEAPGPINYKSWLAPACNSSPHSERFITVPLASNREPIIMERNLFASGITIKSDATWLLNKKE